jgi:hypothetical protein
MGRRSWRLFIVGLIGVVALLACDPVNPPAVESPATEGPLTSYGPDPAPQVVAVASEGGNRAVVWADQSDDLLLDLYNNSSTTPARAKPVILVNVAVSDPETSTEWDAVDAALGNGFVLTSAQSHDCDPNGCGPRDDVFTLRDPSDAPVPLSGDSSSMSELCDPSQVIRARGYALSWNGSTFLVAKECADRLELFTVTTAGVVTLSDTFTTSNAFDVALASASGGFLVAYQATNSAGNVDVRVRLLNSAGALVGGAVTIAGGAGDQVDPTAAGSGSAYLVAWETAGNGRDIGARTIQSNGTLGSAHVLTNQIGDQFAPTVAGGGNGSWFAAWTSDLGVQDVIGTKVLPNGAPVTAAGAVLAGGQSDQRSPLLASGPAGTAFLTWFTPGTESTDIDLTRKLDVDGVPFGTTTRSTRRPFTQTCFDVAAGSGQYLVTWQETRSLGSTDLFAQRYSPSGTPTGPVITISAAPGDQTCPSAAWNGSRWLVAWADSRSGPEDVFGTFVTGAGALSPAAGFAISTAAHEQQSPSVAWNGADFVVAWDDLRHGGQDIFAARVESNGTVLDPSGVAVTTAAGVQRNPSVDSAGGGPTLISWTGSKVQHRILRSNATFVSGTVTDGPAFGRPFSTLSAVATPDRMGVLYEDATPGQDFASDVVFADIDPSTGAERSRTTLRSIGNDCERWPGGDLSFDGTSITFLSGFFTGCDRISTATVGTITGDTVLDADAPDEFMGARLASLSDQRSLLVDQRRGRIIVLAVDDAPT